MKHRTLLLAFVVLYLLSSPAQAQTKLEAENAELRRRVAALEERLEKLEAKESEKPSAKSLDEAKKQAEASSTPPVKSTSADEPPASHPAAAEQKESKESGLLNFLKTTDVSGFIDTYYSFNFNRPAGRESQARSFDGKHNQFALGVAEISFQREPREDSRFGFRLDLNFGPAADFLSSGEPGNIEVYKHMQEAYGSYLAPIGRGLRFDVGKFNSWAGAEEDEAKDNWNYTHGLLYTFATPAYHMGAKATYEFNDRLSLTGALVNGWNNVEENNDGKTFGLLLSLTPSKKLSIEQTYLFGPEQPDDTRHKRHFFDTNIFYDINKRFSLMGNYDYGFDTLSDGTKVRWQGVAAALRYVPAKRLAFSPRFEWYKDYDGFTTGAAQRLREFTFTGEYKLAEHLVTRLEYRRDWSTEAFFQKSDPNLFARTQTTMTGGFIWSFTTKDESSPDEPSTPTPTPPESSAKPKTSSNLAASAVETNRPRRAATTDASLVEQHARLSTQNGRAVSNASTSPHASTDASQVSQTSSKSSTAKVSTTSLFKITDRLPPPAAKDNNRAKRP